MNGSNDMGADMPVTPQPGQGRDMNGGAVTLPDWSGDQNGNGGAVTLPDWSGDQNGNGGAVTLPDWSGDPIGEGGAVTLPDWSGDPIGEGGAVTLPDWSGDQIIPDGGGVPVIPLPNPGEGGYVRPNFPIITVPIQPYPPCFFCGNSRTGRVRFLNAGYGYNPFRVFINNRLITTNLGYAQLTPYGRVSSGFQTVTITGRNGYVYLQKSMPFRADEVFTVAIINTASGLDLLQISDMPCSTPFNMSCFRVSNLAYNSNPLDVILLDGRVVYSDVRFKETTAYKRIRPGAYRFYLGETDLRPMPRDQDIETLDSGSVVFEAQRALASNQFTVRANANYTMYILSRGRAPGAIETMIVEDRQ